MPQINLRDVDTSMVEDIDILLDEIVDIIGCSPEDILVENSISYDIKLSRFETKVPKIEVIWFDRPQVMQDKIAMLITKYFNEKGYSRVIVIFNVVDKDKYYQNGFHY